ncbi:MAG TPA: type IV secretion system protein, partial [Pseudoxanthomonas sp.]
QIGDATLALKPRRLSAGGDMEELSEFVFFRALYDFIHSEIDEFAIDLLARTMALVSTAALSVLTLWILIRGYRIVTGQSPQPMMGLVVDTLRTTLILGLACGMALGGSDLYELLGSDLPNEISRVVTGDAAPINEQIDRNLALMQIAVGRIDALDVMGDTTLDSAKGRASWFAGLGTAGPAMSGGSLLLMNQIALALFIGLGPLFVLSLLFEQTKGLFGKWLYYGIGTMFSLAVLSVIVGISLDMMLKVGAAFWTTGVLTGSTDGLTSLAMQQGCLGLVLTILILSAPPMAAQFFNGVLGNFSPKSVFGGGMGGRGSADDGYAGVAQEASQELHPVQHQFRHTLPAEGNSDQVKWASGAHEVQHSTMPTTADIERRLWVELAAQEAAASGMEFAQARGGPVRMPTPGIPIAENRGWDAALNIAADPLGLLEPYFATKAAMAQLNDAMMKQRVDSFRQSMIDAGVKNVPEGYDRAYFAGGRQGDDYAGTLNKLANQYLDHMQDHRLREMWGDNYKDIRLGKSQMNVLEFEKWVLDAQQKAVDRAYTQGVEAIQRGDIKVENGQYALVLGNYVDRHQKLELRAMARAEGINDSGPSKIWGINRRIKIEIPDSHAIPDNRLGYNLYSDATLSRKTAETVQIQRWNAIRPGHTIIIRPTQLGGSYVIPRSQIPEHTLRPRGK